MNPLKKLASQTAIYGLSSIIGRFLNYLLVPLFTYFFAPAEYGVVAEFYAYMGFFAVLLLFGLETGYFRFREKESAGDAIVYSTALRTVLLGSALFFLAIWLFKDPLAGIMRHQDHVEYLIWTAAILALDAVGSMAFARLRAEEKALRFAGIKLIEIGINVGLNLFFILLCRQAYEEDPNSLLGQLWNPAIGVGYIFIANLVASGVKLLLLMPQFKDIFAGFDTDLFKRMMRYSLPMVIIGFAGIINEMLDRAALKYLLPHDDATNMAQLGIYSACYKLSILMTLFIQAFRYAAEPFFFAYAKQKDAKQVYADVLRYFVIFCVFIFLLVTLYIDIFQYFVGEAYREGLFVVPILLMANLFLGIYINLSIWYKLSDRTLMGAYVAIVGSVITVILLFWWVPVYGYEGAAWAHVVCYGSMALISYLLGRKYYPVPYDLKNLLMYFLIGLGIYFGVTQMNQILDWPGLVLGTLGLMAFLAIAFLLDGRKLIRR